MKHLKYNGVLVMPDDGLRAAHTLTKEIMRLRAPYDDRRTFDIIPTPGFWFDPTEIIKEIAKLPILGKIFERLLSPRIIELLRNPMALIGAIVTRKDFLNLILELDFFRPLPRAADGKINKSIWQAEQVRIEVFMRTLVILLMQDVRPQNSRPRKHRVGFLRPMQPIRRRKRRRMFNP